MLSTRLMLLRIMVLAVFLIFAGSLANLQLWQGAALRQQSENNRLRWVRSTAPRGRILDRKGRPLATCVPALTVWLIPSEVPRDAWKYLMERLVALKIYPDLTTAQNTLDDVQDSPSYLPVALESGLSITDPRVARIEEEIPFLSGVYLKVEPVRYYPGGVLASHVIGYLSEIDEKELAQRKEQGYRMGDRIGKTGVERAFEDVLRGTDGGEQIEVDALGRKIRTLETREPVQGTDLMLTIDLDIQRTAERMMQGLQGAAVVLDPATGDILALVSSPSFDLNSRAQRSEFNKVVRGAYPPGSVFKIVTAAAGLEEGKIRPSTYFYCDGQYRGIRCWKHSGHGALALNGALANSCNVYFMQTAERVGVDPLAAMARKFGLGQTADIDGVLTGQSGMVPDMAWARKRNIPWELGETLQMGIGQSALSITPLQAAIVVSAIANGGKRVHPRLMVSVGGITRPINEPESLGLKDETLSAIDRGLRQVVETGTARQLASSLHIAGKTGTAQNHEGNGIDHAWFVGYAPDEHPSVAVAVLVEHGGHGGTISAPIAGAIIRTALGKDEPLPKASTSGRPSAQPANTLIPPRTPAPRQAE